MASEPTSQPARPVASLLLRSGSTQTLLRTRVPGAFAPSTPVNWGGSGPE